VTLGLAGDTMLGRSVAEREVPEDLGRGAGRSAGGPGFEPGSELPR
jgi:hypothetical protein